MHVNRTPARAGLLIAILAVAIMAPWPRRGGFLYPELSRSPSQPRRPIV